VSAPTIYEGIVIFTTAIPPVAGDPCSSKGSGWLYFVDAKTGGALNFPFLDINGDGVIDDNDLVDGKPPSGIEVGQLLDGMPGQVKIVNGQVVVCGVDTDKCVSLGIPNTPPTPDETSTAPSKGRISWREIIN
jgi:type IV pilus assembly protein PilY1